jgi:hypothetical protein
LKADGSARCRFALPSALVLFALLTGCGSSSTPGAGGASGRQFYVSAQAPAGGNGTLAAPFNTLAAVQQAAGPGDTIIVLPSPLTVAPLDGGITLQPAQKLLGEQAPASASTPAAPRITNSSGASNAGNAVDLAAGSEVANLVIVSPYRSGIYGLDTPGVNIHDNDVSGHNTSCTQGLVIPNDTLPTIFPGITIPFPVKLPNGWAGIMVDADQGTGSITIQDNQVHDAVCGDGIDVRLFNAAVYQADIDGNTIYGLQEPADSKSLIISVLAIGMQTNNRSVLTATIDNNTEHDIGSPVLSPEGSDSEGVFPNVVDASTITASIDGNNFYNGIGGFSANGLEIPVMGDGGTDIVQVSNSTFAKVPGDIIELFALGTNGTLQLSLDNVTASYSTGGSLLESTAGPLGGANNGDCLVAASVNSGNSLRVVMNNSTLTHCYHNGVTFLSNNSLGNTAPTQLIDFDIEGSQITDSEGYGLSVLNLSPLTQLTGKVQNTNFSGNQNFNIGLDNESTQPAILSLDFGGGVLGSTGDNCIVDGGKGGVTASGVSVFLENNWWGSPEGPSAGVVKVQNGNLDDTPALSAPPTACR